MATRKKDNVKIIVKEGDYFFATYNRKKIRGIVGWDEYDEHFFLANNKEGVDVKCEDELDNLGFSYAICFNHRDEADGEGTEKHLYDEGVTNYIVLKDKRQKAIIDKDKLPALEVGHDNYRVSVEDGVFVFGCGDVELTKEQIERYLRFREIKDELNDYEGNNIENMETKDIKAYLKLRENIVEGDRECYDEVISAASNNYHDEDQVNNIDEADIRALFKYAEHVNSKA